MAFCCSKHRQLRRRQIHRNRSVLEPRYFPSVVRYLDRNLHPVGTLCGPLQTMSKSVSYELDAGSLTGLGPFISIALQEDPRFIGHLITRVEPVTIVGMVNLSVLDHVVRIDQVTGFELGSRVFDGC